MSKGKTVGTKCPACNASINFNPKLNKWKCEYCGSEFTLEEMEKVTSGSASKENNIKDKKKKKEDDFEYLVYHCQNCGAEIVSDQQTAATFCVYCGSTTILQNKLEGEFSPDYVIPFKKTKEDAENAFKNIAKGRIFTPKDFAKKENIEKIRGIYIPFWLFDYDTEEDMELNCTNVKTWTTGNYTYTKTDKYDVGRKASMVFNKVPIDASTRFDNDIMDTIQPYDYKDLVDYNHAYLSGFYAERYDQKSDELKSIVEDRVKKSSRDTILGTVNYSTRSIRKDNITIDNKDIKYALLPVWMVNVKYNNKQHLFAMNGQTGEFIGNIPIDKKRATLFTFLVLIITFAVVFLVVFLLLGGVSQ